jgi:surfeit locus 1 family protein
MATGHSTLQKNVNKFAGRTFRFNWKMTLFTVALLPLLINLGQWQLDREQEKLAAQRLYDSRLHQAPQNLDSINWADPDLGWTQVAALGEFLSEKQFLLDNRIVDGRAGYEVITPFVTDSGVVLVNRGWIAQGVTRSELPSTEIADSGIVQIVGHIYVPDGQTFVLGGEPEDQTSWPRVIQRVDVDQMSASLEKTLLPHVVRLSAQSTAALRINWAVVNMQPEVHRGYAVQWFLMAFVLVVLYLMFSFRKLES